MRIRTYSQLRRLSTFEDRFDYLELAGQVGEAVFGHDRWMNQRFYSSPEWRKVRDFVIIRDNGCDLGIEGYEIHYDLIVHHMNPLTIEHIVNREERALDPEFLICTSKRTHNAIHFGDRDLLPKPVVARQPGDTLLW